MQAMQDRIKVVIVDDEPQSIRRLQDDLATLEDFEVIATSSSAVSAKNLVMSIQPDVLFIDVEMPGQTGFEVLQSLREEMPMELIVVFYSAFDKYMIDALRASAFDFLLKPYQQRGHLFCGEYLRIEGCFRYSSLWCEGCQWCHLDYHQAW